MRKITFIAILLLCICNLAKAKEKVIEQPPFIAWSSTSIQIDKVVLSDMATVLYIKAFYQPKQWIRISGQSFLKDNNGETYVLRSGIGIKPDTEFWMPESGEAEFRLVFPPIPASATSIDFSEGDNVQGAFKIWGIQLKGKTLPELLLPQEAIVQKVDINNTLPEPKFEYKEATFKGKILDYRPGLISKIAPIVFDPVKGAYEGAEVKINNDGTFATQIKVPATTPVALRIFGKMISSYVVPGEESSIIINTRELCRQQSKFHKDDKPYGEAVYFGGALAGLSQESFKCNLNPSVMDNYRQLFRDIAGMDAQAYKDFIYGKRATILESIQKASISQALKTVLINQVDAGTAQAISLTEMAIKQAYAVEHKMKNEEVREYFKTTQIKLPENYYADAFRPLGSLNTMALLYNPRLTELVPYYLRHWRDELVKAWGTDKGVYFDINKANELYSSIKDFTPLTAEQEVLLATLPPACQNELREGNEQLLKTIEANKKKTGYTIHEVGEVSDENLFTSIISKFRGKVILADFWATWCGPCRMANKAMLPMKEELKGKDIVYLYLTGETSPLKTWENMIPDIHGEHFRMTDAQWNYLSDKFKVGGIPTYLIIDREGNVKYQKTGFPGTAKMKEELMKVYDEQ